MRRLLLCTVLLAAASCHGSHRHRTRHFATAPAGPGAAAPLVAGAENTDSDSDGDDDSDSDDYDGPGASDPITGPEAFRAVVHGHGRPIIFIPGLGCPGDVWDDTISRLDGYESHVLTLAGFAGQPSIDAPLAATARAELASYIREHKLDHPIIVGHSMGGYLAYWLAESEPDLVGPTIIVDSGAAVGTGDASADAASGRAARDFWATASDDQYAAQVHDIFSQMSADPSRLEPMLEEVARSDRRALGGAIEEMYRRDLRADLGKIRVPVLVVLADGSLQADMRAQAQSVPDHEVVVVPHTKHFVFLDDPAGFVTAVDSFLTAHPAVGTPVAAM